MTTSTTAMTIIMESTITTTIQMTIMCLPTTVVIKKTNISTITITTRTIKAILKQKM